QALSQLSYGPISLGSFGGSRSCPAEARRNLVKVAGNRKSQFGSFCCPPKTLENPAGSALQDRPLAVVVARYVDVEIVALVVLVLEEGVFIVTEVLVDLDILDIRNVVAAVFLGVGFLERHDLGTGGL